VYSLAWFSKSVNHLLREDPLGLTQRENLPQNNCNIQVERNR
jgi:hypothetical protein